MPEIAISNERSELGRVIEFVDAFVASQAMPAETAMQLHLVIEELVMNVIDHGYVAGPGRVDISIQRDGPWLHVLVSDQAPAFDPLKVPSPDLELEVKDRQTGGLGIHMVRAFADEVSYERKDGCNRTRVSKKL